MNLENFKNAIEVIGLLNPITGGQWAFHESYQIKLGEVVVDSRVFKIYVHPDNMFTVIFLLYGLTDESVAYCQNIALARVYKKIDVVLAREKSRHFNERLNREVSDCFKDALLKQEFAPFYESLNFNL